MDTLLDFTDTTDLENVDFLRLILKDKKKLISLSADLGGVTEEAKNFFSNKFVENGTAIFALDCF